MITLGRMFSEHDVLRQLMRLLAELIRRALELASEGKKDEAAQRLKNGVGELLGIEHSVLSMLDARSAVKTLGSQERLEAYVQLLEALAEVEGPHHLARAEALRAQAAGR